MKKLFCVVAGPRLGGKSTLAGTLPGSTLLLQAAVLETGSRSARALAKRNGHKLEIDTFTDIVNLRAKLEAACKKAYDHVYIDGFSAINEMRWGEHDVQQAFKKNAFEAYAKHGDDVCKLLVWIKGFSDGPNGKNIFLTCALKVKTEGGANDVELEAKGRMAVTAITKLGESVVTVMMIPTEQGNRRVLITKSVENWPGRIDGVLDDENPGVIEPDLGLVIALVNGETITTTEEKTAA